MAVNDVKCKCNWLNEVAQYKTVCSWSLLRRERSGRRIGESGGGGVIYEEGG